MARTKQRPGAVGGQSRAIKEEKTLQSQHLKSHYTYPGGNRKLERLPSSQPPAILITLASIQQCREECRHAESVGDRKASRQARQRLFNSQFELITLLGTSQFQEVVQ